MKRQSIFVISVWLIILLDCCLLPELVSSSRHKVRHLRHLIRNTKFGQLYKDIQSDYYNKGCQVQPWGSNLASSSGCPTQRCSKHLNCWQEFGKTKLCICDPNLCGMVCLDYDMRCPFPEHPKHGKVIVTDLRVGDEVKYSCEPGYAVKGPRKRYCQANLKLSGPTPECTDQTDLCFSPPYIPNSVVAEGHSRNDYRNGESVRITCQKGFEDKRNSYMIATCVGNEWRYASLKCERISCGPLKGPKNGRTIYTDPYTYQSAAISFCNDGFRLHCEMMNNQDDKPCKRTCEFDGRWSGVNAICKPILCPDLKAPQNGIVEGTSNKVNNIRRFRCNEGYELAGSYLRNCQLNGEWDGWPAVCKIRDCGEPPKVPFSSLTFEKTTYGSRAEYKCLRGTTLHGQSSVLTCREANNSSIWLPQPVPQCVKHCNPMKIENANIDTISKGPDDEVGVLDSYSQIPHGTKLNITCENGYQLDQAVHPICNNGTFNYVPHCIEASCPKRPDAESNSLVRFYSLKHNSLARYYCHYGYRIISKNSKGQTKYSNYYEKKCIKGIWVRIIKGLCVPTKCNVPPSPGNGKVYLKGQGDRTELSREEIKINHGRIIEYECFPDYRLKGPKIAVCLNGQWSPPSVPTCEFIMHDELPIEWLFYDSGRRDE